VFTDAAQDGSKAWRHLRGIFGFEVVVDEHHQGEGKSFHGENIEGLLDLAVENSKVLLLQIRHQIAKLILYRDGKHDEVRVDADLRSLVAGCTRWAGCTGWAW